MDLLTVENISKNYPTTRALDNVSLKIDAGEVVAIYGKKQSGKRTLINIILGNTKPDTGNIAFNGRNITSLSARKRQSLGLITIDHEFSYIQNIYRKMIPETSIQEYLLKIIPEYNKRLNRKISKKEKFEIIETVLDSFHSQAFINRGFHEQSAGQSRKVMLASCFMRQPKLIVIDDPFYGLDYSNSLYISKRIYEYSHIHRIGFLFSKDLPVLDYLDCDRIYLLESGKIIEEKKKEEKQDAYQPHLSKISKEPTDNLSFKQQIRKTGKEFSVFICYKNTDETGKQTRDSYLAFDIYNYLSERGINAFYSNVSLESLGIAAYQQAIDDALDHADTLIAVGTSSANLDSEWVRYEWSSFYSDILSGRKKKGRLFVYTENVNVSDIPRILRQNQVIEHSENSLITLYNFIVHAFG